MISAKPNSFVGLLGIDQRSLLLKSGNDLTYVCIIYYEFLSISSYVRDLTCTLFRLHSLINCAQDQVYKELQSYDKAEASPHADEFFGRHFWRPGSGTADDVFQVKYPTIDFILSFLSLAIR